MQLRTKTKRRLLLLGGALAAAVTLGVALLMVRAWQVERLLRSQREAGMAAVRRGDHAGAIASLESYLKRAPDDPEALLAFARSRAELEVADGEHLRKAISVYRRYVERRPDPAAERALLTLYNRAGLHQEAGELAERLLTPGSALTGDDELRVLREAIHAGLALRASHGGADASLLSRLERATALAPLDIELRLAQLEVLKAAGRAGDATTMAEGLARDHPGDPRAALIGLLGGVDPKDPEQARAAWERLCALAGLDPQRATRVAKATYPDEAYVARLVSLFDVLGGGEHAFAVLDDAAGAVHAEEVTRLWMRRAWQTHRYDRVLARGRSTVAPEHPDLDALRALAAEALGREAEAKAARQALASRQAEFRARAWTQAFAGLEGGVVQRIDALRGAIRTNPREPIFHVWLGDLLASVGYREDAREEYLAAAAIPLAGSWAIPEQRLAELALANGNVGDAMRHSTTAYERSPRDAGVVVTRFRAHVAGVSGANGGRGGAPALLAFAEQASGSFASSADEPGVPALLDELLVGRVSLLADLDRAGDAAALVVETLKGSRRVSREALERLATTSAARGLAVEELCLDACVRWHGPAPSTAEARALVLQSRGMGREGLALVREGLATAPKDQEPAWRRALARVLDAAGDAGAQAEWIALADGRPEDLALQQEALSSRFACRDAAFVGRATQRLRAVAGAGGTEPVEARLARASALLDAEPDAARREEAIALLRAVTVSHPKRADARELLASALMLEDPAKGIRASPDDAIRELEAVAAGSASPAGERLRLAGLLQNLQRFDRARDQLREAIRIAPADDSIVRVASEMLIAQGDDAEALRHVMPLITKLGESSPPQLMLTAAGALTRERRAPEALEMYRRLAGSSSLPAGAVPHVYVGLRRAGDQEGADRLLAGLAGLAMTESDRLMVRGRSLKLAGDLAGARDAFARATEADKANEEAWVSLVAVQTRAGAHDEAVRAAAAAAKALPGSARVSALAAQVEVAGGSMDPEALERLAQSLSGDAARVGDAAAVRAVDEARAAGKLLDPDALVALAERFPASLAVQNLVVAQLIALTPPRFDHAGRLAARAINNFPTAVEPARRGFEVYAGAGQWTQALWAARSWRVRSGPSLDADGAVAQAHLALGQFRQAAGQIKAHVPACKASPDEPACLLVLDAYLRSMVLQGEERAVREELEPLVKSSRSFRNRVWMRVGAMMLTRASGAAWVEQARTHLDQRDPDDQVALASAWSTLARRFPEERKRLEEAAAILDRLAAGPETATPGVLNLLGITRREAGDVSGAIVAFRRTIAMEPNDPMALANLAELLNARGPARDPAEARRLAEHAYRASQGSDPAIVEIVANLLVDQAADPSTPDREGVGDQLRRAGRIYMELADLHRGEERLVLQHLLAAGHAFDRAGDPRESQAAYARVLNMSSLDPAIRAGVNNNLAHAIVRAKPSPTDLLRADQLSEDASRASPSAAHMATRGMVLAALGRREEAIEAYRSAVEKSPGHAGATIGLATVLAAGPREHVAEARRVLQALPAGAGAGLESWQVEQLNSLRQQIGLVEP